MLSGLDKKVFRTITEMPKEKVIQQCGINFLEV